MGNSTTMSEESSTKKLKSPLLIASPFEAARKIRGKVCVKEAVSDGFKSAAVTSAGTAIPLLYAVRNLPWFKANINHAGQAWIISAAFVAGFYVAADESMRICANRKSQYQNTISSV